MKKMLVLILAVSLMFVSCSQGAYIEQNGSERWVRSYGLCGEPEEGIDYELNVGNAVISFFLLETVVVPIVWGLDEIYVPVRATDTHGTLVD